MSLRQRAKQLTLPPMVAAAVLALLAEAAMAQGRTVRKIKGAEKTAASTVTPEQCTAAVHQIAGRWGSEGLRDALHPDFPNRAELIDSIRRSTLRSSNVALSVEAITGTRLVAAKDGSTDCIADVSTRLQFDDPATGQRQTGQVGRAQWRIRFEPKR